MDNINFFDSELIIRLTPLTSETINIAEDILSKNVKVFHSLSNIKVEKLEYLWEVDLPTAPSTYALYIYAMYPVSYLLNAFEKTNDKKYLYEALSLSKSFVDWQNKDKKNINSKREKILFGDHSTSNRTQVFCYLSTSLDFANIKLEKWLIDVLTTNGHYLSNYENYSHYNHGLMMDLALLGLVNTFIGLNIPYPEYFKHNLIDRLKYSLIRDLTNDGVHVENSPGYHFWMLGFLKRIEKSLSFLDKDIHKISFSALNRATEYARYITRSNGSVPTIGDTSLKLKYTPTTGLNSKFFTNSNIVIFRNKESDVWAYFGSGYKTHVHKHEDDGSFNLFYKGKDVFFDPGFLNYENNEQSMMIKSASFHNTVKPINEDLNILTRNLILEENKEGYKDNLSESRIVGFYYNVDYEASLAKISGYSCGDIERLIVFSKLGYFIIYDRVMDNRHKSKVFEQRFNVGSDLNLKFNKDSSISIIHQKIGALCEIKQLLRGTNITNEYVARKENGFYAKSFNEKSECERLVFSFNGYDSLIVIKLSDYENQNSYNAIENIDLFDSDQEFFDFVDSVINRFN